MPPKRRAFSSINLRCNPFGELPPNELADVALVDLTPIHAALEDGLSVQLLGPPGRGKSTHLRTLQHRVPGAHYARVWSAEFTGKWPPQPPEVPEGTDLLLLDEADQLPWWSRMAVMRRARRVVVATHSDIGRSLRLAGHPNVVHPVARTPSAAWLRDALDRRIGYFRRGDGPVPQLTDDELSHLIDQYGDDLRGMERALYDDFQRRSL